MTDRDVQATHPEGRVAWTLLGDVVGSRATGDRVALHETLLAALAATDRAVPGLEPLVVTVGDEFQGRYAELGDAVLASLLVRLHLLPGHDVRCGIGHGVVQVVDPRRHPQLQDGPGWWTARAAVEEAERRAGTAAGRSCRTWVEVDGESVAPSLVRAARGLLVLRDEMVAQLDDRPRRVLLGVMSDLTQTMIAEQEGISQSAVSQITTRGGLSALKEAHALLRRAAP